MSPTDDIPSLGPNPDVTPEVDEDSGDKAPG